MKNNDEQLEQMIKEEYKKAAREEEAVLREDDSISVPEGLEESLYLKISEDIEMINKGKDEYEYADEYIGEYIDECVDLYANMSEEDKRALEIGRRVMEEEARAEREGKVVRKKKRIRMYIGVAAALVIAMGFGVTSLGGAEKVMKMVTQMVGDREVEQVDSSEDNKIIEANEGIAYQKLSEEFGIEPVRLVIVSENMEFINMELNEVMQVAELCYEYNDRKLIYFISASHKKDSFGYEIADEVIDKYSMEVHGKEIEIKKYKVEGEDSVRYSAKFKETGLKYFLTGIMEQSEFERIVENLHFLW